MHTLTQEQTVKITDILARLDEQPVPTEDVERRHSARVKIRTPLQVMLLTGGAGQGLHLVNVFTRNISPTGISFVSRRMFHLGERIAIAMHLQKVPPKVLLGRITFSRYVKAGMYEMGAQFLASAPDPTRTGHIPELWLHSSPAPATDATAAASRM